MSSWNEDRWILSKGAGRDWISVRHARCRDSLARLKAIRKIFRSTAPARVARRRYAPGIDFLLRQAGPDILCHPNFDYWLALWDRHFSAPAAENDWHLHFGLLQGFATVAAAKGRRALDAEALLDPDGHLHFYGTPFFLEFPKSAALRPVRLALKSGAVSVSGPGILKARFPASVLRESSRKFKPRRGKGWALKRSPVLLDTMSIESCGLLTTQPVVMHGPVGLPGLKLKEFAATLQRALAMIKESEPGLFEELTDLTRVLVPLATPANQASVSSSYVNFRGAICLSHSSDPLLQVETLIHEFCHQKLNQLLLADPLILPGQSGQVFYSPWRPDARRLRGLLLGAHAFLNVAHYTIGSLSREEHPARRKDHLMLMSARRLMEVESALRTLSCYGSFTELGRRFLLGMWQELITLLHATQRFPEKLMIEARKDSEKHRAAHAIAFTGMHRPADLPSQARR